MTTLPTPQNLEGTPLWENYLVAQLTQAALGLVPGNALALGVEVDEFDIAVVCQVPQATAAVVDDVEEIAQELMFLLGERADVSTRVETRAVATMTPQDSTVWIYAARDPEPG